MDFRGLIDARGADIVAKCAKTTVTNVRVWRHRNNIPRNAWPDIMQNMHEIGLSDLLAMESASK